MKITEFRCDLCNVRLGPDRNGIPRESVGVRLDERCVNPPPCERVLAVPSQDATWHLCHPCLAGLVALARRTLPPGEFAAAAPAGATQAPGCPATGLTASGR